MNAPIALVTGANRGLGQRIALALGRDGHRVVVAHRHGSAPSQTLDLLAQQGAAGVGLPVDTADVASFPEFRTQLADLMRGRWQSERLAVLVHNAGVGSFGRFDDVSVREFDDLVATNLRGPFFLSRALLPLLEGGGHIVHVTTSLTRHVSAGTAAYAASKAALEALTRSLAGELGPRGVRVNSVAPGPTATDFNGGAMRDDDALRGAISHATALGRVGRPEEIGDAVAALVSARMRWVTGERLEVSGGAFL